MSVDNHDAPKHHGVDYLIVDYLGLIARAEKRLESVLMVEEAPNLPGYQLVNVPRLVADYKAAHPQQTRRERIAQLFAMGDTHLSMLNATNQFKK